jgi:hypothetical protein
MKFSQRELERLRQDIEPQELINENGAPILYGVERAIFEQQKFKRLIAIARKIKTRTAREQRRQWMRQLECARAAQARFQKLRDDIRAGRPDFLKCLGDSEKQDAAPLTLEERF